MKRNLGSIKAKWRVCIAVLCIAVLCMTACGKQAGASLQEPKQTEESTVLGTLEGENRQTPDASKQEEYVYDYQVSLEPIPKEIADLGGECVGTMHAFPSRIMVGLMKQRMEEEPEFKAEAERRTEEVRKALKEEIGGEFEVELMRIEDAGWRFSCREIATNYKFAITYNTLIVKKINIPEYYEKIDANKYENDMESIISRVYDSGCQSIRLSENEYHKFMYVFIANFRDEDMDYIEEQKRILELWKGLREYDEEIEYRIYIEFYSTEYEEMVCKKYQEGIFSDLSLPEEHKKAIKEAEEIYDICTYVGWHDYKGKKTLDDLLEEYENGTYDETEKWEYWIKGGEY